MLKRYENYQKPIENKLEIKVDDLLINIEKRRAVLKGVVLDLTPKEFDLLFLLASNPGKSYSREDLLKLVWSYDFKGYEHTVNSHVNRLRSKIEKDPNNPDFIRTIWGIGYAFKD